jgi:hypothetical protein
MNSNGQFMMDLSRFKMILDAYGSDPDHWPTDEKQQALTLLSKSSKAKELQQIASKLDLLLDTFHVPEPSPELMAKILMQTPSSYSQSNRTYWLSWFPFEQLWQPATVLAFSAFLGIMVGTQLPPPPTEHVHMASLQMDMEQWAYGPSLQMGGLQ